MLLRRLARSGAAALARLLPRRLAPARPSPRAPLDAGAGEPAVASYHLSVKAVQRSVGRSATACAAYRHAERIACDREGRVHDYRAKAGVEASFIVAPDEAPAWAQDRQALWNAAEARETRKDGVTAREWELALPHELGAAGRRELAHAFARELVGRYGVAADVAIHAPHREGDQRNWHAHVLTTTRVLAREGLTDKTRVLDVKATGGPEIAVMRERWAELQNQALERAHVAERVDHRTLAVQREEARALGHEARADNLDRAPEVKLGPVVSGIERREERAAEREGRAYVPLTERGAQVHEARAARGLLAELDRLREALREEVRERAALARQTYAQAREEGADPMRAGLAALRAAAQRQGIGEGHPESLARINERLRGLTGQEAARHALDSPRAGLPAHGEEGRGQRDRLGHGSGLERGREAHRAHEAPGAPGADPMREALDALRARARPGARHEAPAASRPAHELGHGREHEGSREAAQKSGAVQEPDPINAQLKALLAHQGTAAERHGPVARLVERTRNAPTDARSFPSAQEAQAFREEMERRFDPGTLARLGQGEERALLQVAGNRLDGLRVARAYLDSRGEPERSEARMRLTYGIVDAQHEARREREAHTLRRGYSLGL